MDTRQPLVWAIVVACGAASAEFVFSQENMLNNPPVPAEQPEKPNEPPASKQTGLAAFYHVTFQGRRTASGESFDHNELTAAHKTLPFGTLVRVINLRNNQSVIVRVNDRGPMQPDRVIDVTRRAAGLLGFLQQGMTRVALEILPLETAGK
jgi:peptidoglycan lytic transglycosylase